MTALTATATALQCDQRWQQIARGPIVVGQRMPDGVDPAGLSRFREDVWDLAPLSRRRNEPGRRINWATFPQVLREEFKWAGWALLNLPTPAALLERAATARVEYPGTGTIAAVTDNWRRYATWLAGRGITGLSDVDVLVHEDYAAYVAGLPLVNRTRIAALYAVSLLWGYAPHVPEGVGVPMPPWEADGLSHFLPAEAGSNENLTPPIHPAVMSPLLVWALRFVEDFAADILAALAEHQRLKARVPRRHNPEAAERLRILLDDHARTGTPLPGEHVKGRLCIAVSYLAALTGASIVQTSNALRRYTPLPIADAAPLDTPISGVLHGRPWRTHINYAEAPVLATRLATACLVVVTYLSGARPAEALHLRVGCCPDPVDAGGGARRYQLCGATFKGARTSDGRPAPDGAPHTWTVIPPVHTAAQVLEHLTTTDALFPLQPAWLRGVSPNQPRRPELGRTRGRRRRRGDVITAKAANNRIAEFIKWVNDYSDIHNLPAEAIPADPDGPVVISRFRRTIAWHIARLPGGRIALAIQYSHLRTTISEGYSGRARHGLRRVLDIETARAMADHLHQLNDRIDHGEQVTGPAARRLIDAARDATTRFAGMFLTPRQIRALQNDPTLQVHDNPQAFLACVYDPAKALCHPDRTGRGSDQPRLDRCNPACANIARTDEHLTALTAQTAQLQGEIANPLTPQPIRDRLAERVAALERIVDRHTRNRTTGETEAADA